MIAEKRLCSQRLAGNPCKTPEDVVRWMGAMQAQDYGQAVWAIGARTPSATLVEVEQAIEAGKMLRTWPMRGTIHFVLPENAKWMVNQSLERSMRDEKRRQAQLGLDEATLERSKQIFHDALRGSRRLTRPAMLDLLEQSGISTASQRGYHILWYAAQTGLTCIGPMEGKQQTFVLLDEWAPNARDLPREEALVKLAGMYFTGHGPATVQDFAWWAGLTAADARAGLAGARKRLVSMQFDGKEYWFSEEAAGAGRAGPDSVHLLAGFDEYLLGYTGRTAIMEPKHLNIVVPGGNGIFRPILVVAGRVAGTWKREVKKKGVEISVVPFVQDDCAKLSKDSGLQSAAERYSRFHGLPLAALRIEQTECVET